MTTEERAKELPEKIWFEEKSGTNGYHCLDYPNWDDSVMYIRSDFAKQETAEIQKRYLKEERNHNTTRQKYFSLKDEYESLREQIKELASAVVKVETVEGFTQDFCPHCEATIDRFENKNPKHKDGCIYLKATRILNEHS